MLHEPTATFDVARVPSESQLPSSREEAKRLGLKHYFTGRPCPSGHVAKRLVSCFQCMECGKLNAVSYGARNPDKIRIKNARRDKEKARLYAVDYWNRPEVKEKKRIWQGRVDKEKRIASNRRWREENPNKCREYKLARRARKANAIGSHSAKDIRELFSVQKGRCSYFNKCQTSLKSGYHVDHIIALANGGTNFRSNLQLLCPRCNMRKKVKDPILFAQELGFLV